MFLSIRLWILYDKGKICKFYLVGSFDFVSLLDMCSFLLLDDIYVCFLVCMCSLLSSFVYMCIYYKLRKEFIV